MATTDARTGFRLPWTSDRPSSDQTDGEAAAELDAAYATAWPNDDVASTVHDDAAPEAAHPTPEPGPEPGPEPAPESRQPTPSGRKPSRFLADMTKAMQAAAEDARTRSLAQLQADAKTHIESIHGRSSTEAADLRKAADDDVAAVRDWSKAEIARIRAETDARIDDRKNQLEREIEEHAAIIEREIEAVQTTVASFEADMAAFFERLLAEEDPTQFATLFESLPEPPSLDDLTATPAATAAPTDEAVDQGAGAAGGEAMVEAALAAEAAEAAESAGFEAETVASAEAEVETELETVASAEPETGPDALEATVEPDPATDPDDPRLAALGLSPDFGAAEAEASAGLDPSSADEEIEIPVIGDDALAARLAGLVPDARAIAPEAVTTEVVVVGLVSVASIASFKRHLSRLPGVSSVGVSSGPEGEFVFAVGHSADVVLRDVIPGLPTFQARVTASSDGTVNVTAHDPESDA